VRKKGKKMSEFERMFRHVAANHLTKRSPSRYAELQKRLDEWNTVAATLSDIQRHRAVAIDLRRRMEWALANGEVADARRFVAALDRMARKKMPPVAGALPTPPDIIFPATLVAMIDEFDAREYAAMMRA
jgi:hypothetical protein